MSMFSSNRIAARVTSTLYHYGNHLPGTSNSYWQLRTDQQRAYKIPFAADGVIDLGLGFHNALTASSVGVNLTASIQAFMDLADAGITEKGSQRIWAGTIPPDARFYFLPERGTAEPGTTTQKIIELPELRQPIHSLYLYLQAETTPDAGEIYLRVIRRY